MAEVGRRQGAPTGKAAAGGGPQPAKNTGRSGSRPRDNKQRPAYSVRLNQKELAVIKAGAEAARMSIAGFLAHSALAAASDLTRTTAAIATDRDVLTELFALRRHFGQAGNNLNQAARVLNSGGDAPHIHAAITAVHHAAEAIQQLVTRILNPHKDQAA